MKARTESQVGTAQNTREKRNPKLGRRKILVKNRIPSWDGAKYSLKIKSQVGIAQNTR